MGVAGGMAGVDSMNQKETKPWISDEVKTPLCWSCGVGVKMEERRTEEARRSPLPPDGRGKHRRRRLDVRQRTESRR